MDECFDEMEHHLSSEQEKVKERVNGIRKLHDELASGRKPETERKCKGFRPVVDFFFHFDWVRSISIVLLMDV